MNPFLNGSDQLSSCSLSQIAPVVARASCLVPIDVPEPGGLSGGALGALALLAARRRQRQRRRTAASAHEEEDDREEALAAC